MPMSTALQKKHFYVDSRRAPDEVSFFHKHLCFFRLTPLAASAEDAVECLPFDASGLTSAYDRCIGWF